MNGVAVGSDDVAAGEGNVAHVSALLVALLVANDSVIAEFDEPFRRLQVKERQSQPVDAAGARRAHAVVDNSSTETTALPAPRV